MLYLTRRFVRIQVEVVVLRVLLLLVAGLGKAFARYRGLTRASLASNHMQCFSGGFMATPML